MPSLWPKTGIATNLRDQPNSLELQPTMTDSSALILNVNDRHRDLAISAVVMDEFLKELSAISQEMSIVLLNENFMRWLFFNYVFISYINWIYIFSPLLIPSFFSKNNTINKILYIFRNELVSFEFDQCLVTVIVIFSLFQASLPDYFLSPHFFRENKNIAKTFLLETETVWVYCI